MAPFKVIGLLLASLMVAGCAATPRARPETSSRVKDSVPEKIAAQRAAENLQLEQEDERWGIEAARERQRAAEQRKTTATQVKPTPTGPLDIREATQTPSTK